MCVAQRNLVTLYVCWPERRRLVAVSALLLLRWISRAWIAIKETVLACPLCMHPLVRNVVVTRTTQNGAVRLLLHVPTSGAITTATTATTTGTWVEAMLFQSSTNTSF